MIAVDVKRLRKVYRLYQSPNLRLKEIILRRPFHSEFVALDDVTFSIPLGETLGIIGENGAGKSTLLKILAKTLKPTSGELEINGRTAALLELGSGFNPELTGEENIYLNAYLMGLTKADVENKKQEIVDFSELGDFIRRPVKTYSSGMQVRLAFSVATSVDPDILIIDEALAVGDQHFQKKCIDRMASFRSKGKTILFCSHSMYHVQELCTRTAWIKDGRLKAIGKTNRVLDEYLNYVREKDAVDAAVVQNGGESSLRILSVDICDEAGDNVHTIATGKPVYLRARIRNNGRPMEGHFGFSLMRNDEEMCFATSTHFDGLRPITFAGEMELKVFFPSFNLLNGVYFFRAAILDLSGLHLFDTAGSQPVAVQKERRELGMFLLNHEWRVTQHG